MVKVPRNATLSLRVNIGNTQEAKWLAPSSKLQEGGVYLVSAPGSDIAVRCAIPRDVARFEDVEIAAVALGKVSRKSEVRLLLEAVKRGRFGQKFSFCIVFKT